MYCSNCGNNVKAGLNYCNSCGGKMQGNDIAQKEVNSVATSLSTALGYIGAGGFGALILLLVILLKENPLNGMVVMIVGFFLVTLLGICFGILHQISKVTSQTAQQPVLDPTLKPTLNSPNTNQLDEPKQSPASVVENTTRTLDRVKVERK